MIIKDFVLFNPKGKKPTDYVNYIDTSSVEDGKTLLQMTHSLCEWFMQTYGDWDYQSTTFVMPVEQKEVPAITKQDEKVKEDLSNVIAKI